VENTILIKESLANSDELTLQGNVWHEHGHSENHRLPESPDEPRNQLTGRASG
jgi:hypothetical protein